MSDKDLGEITENVENEVESLKNTKMKVFGITVTPTSIMGALALAGTLLGTLYGAFESYKAFQEMSEKLNAMDIEAVEERNIAIERKLNDAIDYTRDIKNGLRDDILRIEKQVDRTEDLVRETEDNVRASIQRAEERFENKRDALQNDYNAKASDLRDRSDQAIEDLEARLNKKIQRALDNPLAN